MAKKWTTLYDNIPADRRAKIEAQVTKDLAEMPLSEMRRARELTQQEIARSLDVNQAWVSKIERQTDMYVSTLRSYVEAMGGELEIVARFHDRAVRLSQFEEKLDSELNKPAEAENQPKQSIPSAESAPIGHPAIWTSLPSEVRIWRSGDQTATTRSQTPSINTPGRHNAARAA
jgi:transcriptional regulator with XRE-family HTH domain